jgi:hypothetical protein
MSMEIVVTGDCIFYVKDLLPKDLCRTVIENYEGDPRRRPGCTVGSRGEKRSYDDVKVSTDLGIDHEGGRCGVFPTFWTHMHCGEIPRSEDKYIVSSFLCFDIPAAGPKS